MGMVGRGGSVDASQKHQWMGIVINAKTQKSIRALFWILQFSHSLTH